MTTGLGNAISVVIDSNGQLGTVSSSRRSKEDIHDMDEASSGLLNLRPVIFRYRSSYADGSRPFDYGLIAEEVAEVYPDLVARNADGEIESVQYHKLIPMLLNELQKQHRAVQELRAAVEDLSARVDQMQPSPRLGRVSAITGAFSSPGVPRAEPPLRPAEPGSGRSTH